MTWSSSTCGSSPISGARKSWSKRSRSSRVRGVSFRVDNLFDAHQSVTDSNGATPLRYQPLLLDPNGRTLKIEFRKLF